MAATVANCVKLGMLDVERSCSFKRIEEALGVAVLVRVDDMGTEGEDCLYITFRDAERYTVPLMLLSA